MTVTFSTSPEEGHVEVVDGSVPDADLATSHSVELNGLELAWREAGPADGEPLLLIHGLAESSRTWDAMLPALVERGHRVIAVDLLGHGRTSTPRIADYSIPGLSVAVRDLLLLLELDSVTLVGHSLGGGIALQLAYLWPELVGRVVLVSSGGLGRTVGTLLRLASIPVPIGPLMALPINRLTATAVRRFHRRLGSDHPKTEDWVRVFEGLADPARRRAFLRLVRGAIDLRGQQVAAIDRLHLADSQPLLIVWGEDDAIVPVGHGRRAHALVADSRLEVLPDTGHFPHLDHPERVAQMITRFLEETEPSKLGTADLAARLRGDRPAPKLSAG